MKSLIYECWILVDVDFGIGDDDEDDDGDGEKGENENDHHPTILDDEMKVNGMLKHNWNECRYWEDLQQWNEMVSMLKPLIKQEEEDDHQ